MDSRHRLDDVCPECGLRLGTFSWLQARVNASNDGKKIGSNSYLVIESRCPECGVLSWCHYSEDLVRSVESDPSILVEAIRRYG